MARNVVVNGSSAKEIFVNNGSWQTVKEVWIKNGGSWVQCYPAIGTQIYSTAGTYSFTVPNGIYTLTVSKLVGAGGGGGGFRGNGDNHAGGGGGSGGYYENQTLAVTPGETLTVTVGAGGGSASYNFNGGWQCIGTVGQSGEYWNGTAGGDTSIKRGTTELLKATGGGPGLGAGPGDTMGTAAPGAGGSPNGVVGGTPNTNRNSYPPAPGGSNGTGYGTGGNGNGNQSGLTCPGVGGTGYVGLSWS